MGFTLKNQCFTNAFHDHIRTFFEPNNCIFESGAAENRYNYSLIQLCSEYREIIITLGNRSFYRIIIEKKTHSGIQIKYSLSQNTKSIEVLKSWTVATFNQSDLWSSDSESRFIVFCLLFSPSSLLSGVDGRAVTENRVHIENPISGTIKIIVVFFWEILYFLWRFLFHLIEIQCKFVVIQRFFIHKSAR